MDFKGSALNGVQGRSEPQGSDGATRRWKGSRRESPWPSLLTLALWPVLLHWPALTGWLSEDPRYVVSGLTAHSWTGNGLLSGTVFADGNAGVTLQALGGLSAADWLAGRVPWWNPYSGLGMPLAGEGQTASFFLPFVLLLRLAGGVVWLRIVMQALAGLASAALLGELGVGGGVAVVGGLLFEMNGSFAWFGHAPILPVAFLPLLLFGIERARRDWRGVGWIGLAVGLSLLAGFPETALLDGLLGAAWAVLRLWQSGAGWRLAGRLVARLGGGVAIGVGLAAPALLAFLVTLPHSYLGQHDGLAHPHLSAASYAMLLLPSLYGPPLYGFGTSAGVAVWYSVGGYAGLGLVLAAVLGAVAPGREAGLRRVLAGWVVVTLGCAGGLPVLSEVSERLPLVGRTLLSLYVAPSWSMALVVLAALALERRRSWRGSGRLVAGCGAGILVALVGALVAAWPQMAALAAVRPGYPMLAAVSVGIEVGLAGGAWLALGAGRRRWAAGLLLAEATLLFSVPLAAGVRGAGQGDERIDDGAVAFLRSHLGLQRVVSLGGIVPNYGALYGLASVNYNALPVPADWVAFVRGRLDPGSDRVSLYGGIDASKPDGGASLAAFAGRVGAYAALGVRYLVVPRDAEPSAEPFGAALAGHDEAGAAVAHPLLPGEGLGGTIAAGRLAGVRPGSVAIGAVGVEVGTYGGAADGAVGVRVCAAAGCAEGVAGLGSALDNALLTVRLGSPLVVGRGEAVGWRVTHRGGSGPVAVWLWRADGSLEPRLRLQAAPVGPVLVWHGQALDVWELPGAAGYWQAACRLERQERDRVTARCDAPARLTRLALAYPGWRASVDGVAAPITTVSEVLQAVELPAGVSHVRFVYRPPGSRLALLVSGGAALLLGWIGAGQRISIAFRAMRMRRPYGGARKPKPETRPAA